jgi:hypothetical protein
MESNIEMSDNLIGLAEELKVSFSLLSFLESKTPGFGPYQSIRNQLLTVQEWAKSGLPFEAQKVQSLNPDLIAVRELEVIPFDEAMDLADLVYKIMFFLKDNCS